jgi:2-keto-4-pentenoate hydratase
MSDNKAPQGRGPLPQKFPHEPERYRKAAELIVAMRRGQIELQGVDGFPEDAAPRNRAEAQIINDLVIGLLGRPVLGWKFYINATIQQAPLRTAIFDIFESPAVLSEKNSQHRWIEPELAFRALCDFPPQEKPYSYREILDAFEAVPVFEIIGPRFRFDSAAHMRQVVNAYRINPRFDGLADGNASGGYVVGKPVRDWQDFDWLKMRVTMDAGKERLVDTIGGHPLVDPFISIFPLVNMMRERDGIKAGMLMATHSYSGFLPVPADEKVVSTFSYFEPIEAVFKSSN